MMRRRGALARSASILAWLVFMAASQAAAARSLAAAAGFDAAFVAQTVPPSYRCIQQNRYGSRAGNRVQLPGDVAPGASVQLAFTVKPGACVSHVSQTRAITRQVFRSPGTLCE